MCLLHFSVCLSICLSKYLHIFVCMSVCLSLSLNICGVVPADQGSRARYRAFQVFCCDSKSVPFPINLSWWKSVIMVLNYALFISNHYPHPLTPPPMSKSGPDVFLIFKCSGICPTPAQRDILVSD